MSDSEYEYGLNGEVCGRHTGRASNRCLLWPNHPGHCDDEPKPRRVASSDMVVVPRDLLLAARIEIRALTAHWATGLAPLAHLVRHDRLMADGSCGTCQMLELIEHYASEEPA